MMKQVRNVTVTGNTEAKSWKEKLSEFWKSFKADSKAIAQNAKKEARDFRAATQNFFSFCIRVGNFFARPIVSTIKLAAYVSVILLAINMLSQQGLIDFTVADVFTSVNNGI